MQKNSNLLFKNTFLIAITASSIACAKELSNTTTNANIELPTLLVVENTNKEAPPNVSTVTKNNWKIVLLETLMT